MIKDDRFARLHNDPRFQRQPKKERRVVVDKRFSAMFSDESFQDKAAVDRYGRKQPKSKAAKEQASEVDRLFRMQDEEAMDAPNKAAAAPPKKTKKASSAARRREMEEYAVEADEDALADGLVQPVVDDDHRGDDDCNAGNDDDGDYDSESLTSSDDDEDDELEAVQEKPSALVGWLEGAEDVPRVSDSTSRLAVCNCDWDQVRAVDLYCVLRSFLPSGGRILNVTVYPSDFGELRMAEEATVGPTVLMTKGGEGSDDDDGGGSGGCSDGGSDDDQDPEKANEKLRQYELDRLKYYFAVVTCDSVGTADRIYSECDGAEFEASSLPLDLRFIPEDMKFPKAPRDEAHELPPKYVAPTFMCSALQQSKPILSWDKDDSERSQMMKKDFSKAEVKEMEYAAYLASSSDDDGEEGEEEYAFGGARPLKAQPERLSELLHSFRSGGEAEGSMEMSFAVAEKGSGTGGRRNKGVGVGGGLEDEGPPTVFQVQEGKRKAKIKAKRAALKEGGGNAEGDAVGSRKQSGSARGARSDDARGARGVQAEEEEEEELFSDDDMPEGLDDDPFFTEAMAEREEEEAEARIKARNGEARPSQSGPSQSGARTAVQRSDDGKPSFQPPSPAGPPRAEEGRAAKRSKKGKKRRVVLTEEEAAEEARREAELELLMLGDQPEESSSERRGFDTKSLELPRGKSVIGNRKTGGKRKREAAAAAAAAAAMVGSEGDAFTLDVGDARFRSIYSSTDFAIDPTHPKFRHTAGSEQLLAEIQKRHTGGQEEGEPRVHSSSHASSHSSGSMSEVLLRGAGGEAGGESGGLWRLVSKVKARATNGGNKALGSKALGSKAKVRQKR